EAVARLRQEAQVVSTIGHPNICEVFDMGRIANGSHYLVMERLRGESLADRLKDDGPMSFIELAPLVRQILKALAAAHKKGILHRDLKPENIFIEEARQFGKATAKLLDFGISKSMSYDFVQNQRLTHTGMVMGTPYYMAPEQARGDSGLDQRVDLWAVGVIMYEALTGRRPFVATNYNALLVKILTSKPRPVQKLDPNIPQDVAAIVDRALSKLREDRFQEADEFRAELGRVEKRIRTEDPHAATSMMTPRRRRQAPAPAVSKRNWREAIDDPATFVDDGMVPEPRATRPDRRPLPVERERNGVSNGAPPSPATHGSWGAFEIEPIEPTVVDPVGDQDDWEQSIPYEPDERLRLDEAPMEEEGHDTEVIVRRDFERAALHRAPDVSPPWRVRGAVRQPAYFSDRGTEIIDRHELERRARERVQGRQAETAAESQDDQDEQTERHHRGSGGGDDAARGFDHHPIDQSDPDGGPTEPVAQAVLEEAADAEARGERLRGREGVRTEGEGAGRRSDGGAGRGSSPGRVKPSRPPPLAGAGSSSGRGGRPRIPRPRAAPDDDEKTTLFNPSAARARRDRAAQGGYEHGGSSGEDES
ncbi:MAG TPA: serine/threonine protein kinase, partial [Polyangiaceae bacterium]|nr:serine/threonine protein kinase [Polyangiaceae bacterium]